MQVSIPFLVLATFVGLVQAGWDSPTHDLSYDSLCRLSFTVPRVKHICFQGPEDVSRVFSDKTFHGFVQPGSKTNFVLYQSPGDTAYYESGIFMVNVNWDITPKPRDAATDSHCAAYYVSLTSGVSVTEGVWCPDKAPVVLIN